MFCCKITIGKMVFGAASEIEIFSTWRRFTDTAKIKLPKALYYYEGDKLKPVQSIKDFVKTGDPVKIELGYNNQLFTRFEGYVARSPRPTIPYEIECEDEMWQMKRKEVSVSIEDATVRQILEAAAPGYEIDCPDEFFGDFSQVRTTPALIFDELRQRGGLYTFFRGKRLVCGLQYVDQKLPDVVPNLVFGRNVVDSTLKYRTAEDCKVKIYGTSRQKNGTVIRASVGVDGGDIVRRPDRPYRTKKQLEEELNRILSSYKTAGGYSGDIKTFGWPNVVHGQRIRIVDPGIYEKRDSVNFIDSVRITVSVRGGYKQIIEAGKNA